MIFLFKKLCLLAIRMYQAGSFLLYGRCRFWPTCSEYTRQAIETHGPARGIRLGFQRILRCHPLGGSGFDPVPEKKAS
jgi:putative membrane protein insertion efficiency factor